MSDAKLFGRVVVVTVGTIQIRDLDVQFEVEKSLKKDPNRCDLTIFNLNGDHRKQLGQLKSVPVRVEAGYQDQTSLIFSGDLRNVYSTRDGADVLTKLSSGDGEKRLRTARINKSYAKGTPVATVLEDAGKALGVGIGNLVQAIRGKGLQGVGEMFSGGTVLSGNAADEFDGLARSAGLEWSIQDGNLQVLARKRALEGLAVKLTADTGLIGSPTIDAKNVVHATCLLIPDIFPGRQVRIEAEHVRGDYRASRCVYTGDTFGTDWQIELECTA
jgi:hypothetical protein